MDQPLLQFNEEPYDADTLKVMLSEFRDRGYVRLPDVFIRDTVDDYVKQVHEVMYHNGLALVLPDDSPLIIWPAQAPRIRQLVTPALSHSVANPLPSLYFNTWVIQPQDKPGVVPGWHKDREPDGMPGKEYHYPKDVFMILYFTDMTEEYGPTKIIPGSHRDLSLTPFAGSAAESIICRKEDGFLLDQRAWHCGTPRKVPGIRTLVVYGFFPVPFHYSFPFRMPRAQRNAWLESEKRADKAFFGGIFAPPDELKR